MEKEFTQLLRDISSSFHKLFSGYQKETKEQNKKLLETISDEAIATRNSIKKLAEPKKEKPDEIDFKPLVRTLEGEGNFTRKTLEAVTKSQNQNTDRLIKAQEKSQNDLLKAVKDSKPTIPPFPEYKAPIIDFKSILNPLSDLFKLVKEGFNKTLARGTKEDPIYVKQLTPDGQELDPSKVIAYGGFGGGGTGGGTIDTSTLNQEVTQVEIKNAIDNLATLLGQFQFDGTGNLEVTSTGGGAGGDVNVDKVSIQLQKILQFIQRNTYIDPSTGQIRVLIGNASVAVTGTLTGVTTVSTVTTMSQLAGFDAKQSLLYAQERSAWALNVRGRIV